MSLTDFCRISKGALGGSNKNLCGIQKLGRPIGLGHHVILTLDPKKFAEKKQQRLHIGNLQTFRPLIRLQKSDRIMDRGMGYDVIKQAGEQIRHFYPPHTKAFLYYFTPPERPPIAGELRLRVASSDDSASFESGSDLLRADGGTWSRPLFVLPKLYSDLYEKLREDQLVPHDLEKVLSTLPSINPIYRRSHLMYTLNDTFIVDFSKKVTFFFVVTEQGVEKSIFLNPFLDYRQLWGVHGAPYTGSALARFERSTLLKHKDTRTVVLRIIKMITPLKCVRPLYDGYICCPKEGELYRKTPRSTRKSDKPVWSFDVDKLKGQCGMRRGFQLLWDV